MENNQGRKITCPTNKVEWLADNQFWLPSLHVMDAIALVRPGENYVVYWYNLQKYDRAII